MQINIDWNVRFKEWGFWLRNDGAEEFGIEFGLKSFPERSRQVFRDADQDGSGPFWTMFFKEGGDYIFGETADEAYQKGMEAFYGAWDAFQMEKADAKTLYMDTEETERRSILDRLKALEEAVKERSAE